MRISIAIVVGLNIALFAGCTANPEKRVPREAANAMTGSPETLTAVSGLTIESTGTSVDVVDKSGPDAPIRV